MVDNWNWMVDQAKQHAEADDYWMHVRGIQHQLEGMWEGYVLHLHHYMLATAAQAAIQQILK